MGVINSTYQIISSDWEIHKSTMSWEQKAEDIKTYQNSKDCEITQTTIEICQELKDKIGYIIASANIVRIYQNRLETEIALCNKSDFQTREELIEFLLDKRFKHYLSKVYKVNIGKTHYYSLYHISFDNLDGLRQEKLEELLNF